MSSYTPRLLVSVASAQECATAMAGGADWIDVKDPHRGALGRAPVAIMRDVVGEVAERRPVSLALGELASGELTAGLIGSLPPTVRYVKVGLSRCRGDGHWPERLAHLLSWLPEGVEIVAVQYADWQTCGGPAPMHLLELAGELPFAAFLVDTYEKGQGNLWHFVSQQELTDWFGIAAGLGLLRVAAGSLSLGDVETVCHAGADLMAVRGAACAGGTRTEAICSDRVAELRAHLLAKSPEIS